MKSLWRVKTKCFVYLMVRCATVPDCPGDGASRPCLLYESQSAKTPTASSRSSEVAPELARPRQTDLDGPLLLDLLLLLINLLLLLLLLHLLLLLPL